MELDERRTRRPDASDVVAACEAAWRAFQRHHPELPDAVIVLGSGVDRGRLVKLGHWWGGRWEADGEHRGEVLLAGEALHLPVEDVFEVLLHEAAHGVNAARDLKDTSRGGRYHNAGFRATAVELGLVVNQLPPYGWAKTTLGAAAGERYDREIDALREAVRIARRIDARTVRTEPGREGEGRSGASGGRGSHSLALSCGCGRRMRMAPSVAAEGPVLCGLCGVPFSEAGIHQRPLHRTASMALPASDVPMQSAGAEVRASCEARARAWAVQHGECLDEPLLAADLAEAAMLNRLARAERCRLGQIDGPEIGAGDMVLGRGDQVVVAAEPAGLELPDVGVVGEVVAVSPGRRGVTIDFPIAGRYHLDADTAGRHLDYGYAVTASFAALPAVTGRAERRLGLSQLPDLKAVPPVLETGLELS